MKKILGIAGLLALVCLVTGIISPTFFTTGNVENLFQRSALFGIISIGAAFVCRRVYAAGEAADDAESGTTQVFRELVGILPAAAGRITTADDRQRGEVQRVQAAGDEQALGRTGDLSEQVGKLIGRGMNDVMIRVRRPIQLFLLVAHPAILACDCAGLGRENGSSNKKGLTPEDVSPYS